MQRLRSWFGLRPQQPATRRPQRRRSRFETLERREVFTASPLPVLMVIADNQDFYYKEYGDTRDAIELRGLDVVVAAETTNPSTPHYGSGEPAGGGVVTPDIALADVDPSDYSAIVFVGGWGASSYQYAFEGTYDFEPYNGNVATKEVVNDLIGDFVAQDKYVAAICHATTVLAWARVDGVSPLQGKQVSTPYIGAPAVEYNGIEYGNFGLMQYGQMVANGAIANTESGQYGVAGTAADDVVVDGRIITAENYDSATEFGRVIATQLLADATPVNQTPIIASGSFAIPENSAIGTIIGTVVATDADEGQSHTYEIIGGNNSGVFSIDSTTGQIIVANPSLLDFEVSPLFNLVVQVTDNGNNPLAATAEVAVNLLDVDEAPLPGIALVDGNLHVQGTSGNDTVYVWTDHLGHSFAWLNGVQSGPHALGGGRVIVFGGDGNDQIFATDSTAPVTVYGEAGHDMITGGSHNDLLDGGAGVDRIYAGAGDDMIFGGEGGDNIDGGAGNDIVAAGAGNDRVFGSNGRDLLIGGLGEDHLAGGDDDDLLIGGTTSYDAHQASLLAIMAEWTQPTLLDSRVAGLSFGVGALQLGTTVQDDGSADSLIGGLGDDWIVAFLQDNAYGVTATDRVTV